MLKLIATALLSTLVLACGGGATATPAATGSPRPATTASPEPAPSQPPATDDVRQGVQGLVADLVDAGATAETSGTFNGEPLALDGTLVCVNGEAVRVYSYAIPEEAAAAAAQIDPDDPSNVGSAIVEWVGTPRFWLRDRMIVVYSDDDEATVTLLADLMGDPFAQGEGRPALLPDGC